MKTMVLRGAALLLPLLCTISPGLIDAAVPKTLTNFTLYNQVLDWHKANALCQSEGKHLIRVENAEKHDFLKEAIKELFQKGYQNYINKNIWIDAYAPIPGVAEFLWSTCSQLSFISWQPNYPQNLTDNRCLLLDTGSSNLTFQNDPCSINVNVVCEKELTAPCRFILHPNSPSPSLLSGLNLNSLLTSCENTCTNDELCWAYTVSGVLSLSCVYGTIKAHESWVPYLTGSPDISSLPNQNPIYIKRCYGYSVSENSQAPSVLAQFPNCSVIPFVESYSTISILTTEQLAVLSSPNEVSPTGESFSTVSAMTTGEFNVLLSPSEELSATEDYVPIPTQTSTVNPAVYVSIGLQVGMTLSIVPTSPDLTPTLPSVVVQDVPIPTQTSTVNPAVDVSVGPQAGMTLSIVPTSPDLTLTLASDVQELVHMVITPTLPSDVQGLVHMATSVLDGVSIDGALASVISGPLLLTSLLNPVLPVPTISDLLQVVPSIGFPLDVLKPSQKIRPSNLCSCFCKFNTVPNPVKEVGHGTSSLVKELTVNHSSVSMTRRKLTSASDDRKSALVMGLVGVGVLTATCLIVVIPDVIRFIKWFRFLRTEKARLLATKQNDDEEGGPEVFDEFDGVESEHSPGEMMSDPSLTEGESEV